MFPGSEDMAAGPATASLGKGNAMLGSKAPVLDETDVVVRIPEAGMPLLTVEEVAELLHVSEEVLHLWAKNGEGPPFYSWAKTPFYLRSEVSRWLWDGALDGEMAELDLSWARWLLIRES
jgi:hypothetical protein